MSPSNFMLTNPEVLRETINSGGQSLIKGLNNLLEDLARGEGGRLRMKMTDTEAFRLGENIALTPGKVVFQNELLQLDPVPAADPGSPCAAAADHSAVDQQVLHPRPARQQFLHQMGGRQGHTVFVISWVNPDQRLAHKAFDDYCSKARWLRSTRSSGQPASTR